MTTFSAPCPRCGTTIFTTIGGQAWLTCPSCAWYGLLNVAQMMSLGQPSPATQPATARPSSPSSAGALLDALRTDALLYGSEIADAVWRLTTHEARDLTLSQVWDRMQQAQDTLYRALGERRMGDYPPDIEQVTRALVEVGVWHIVALGVVERLNHRDEVEQEEGAQ